MTAPTNPPRAPRILERAFMAIAALNLAGGVYFGYQYAANNQPDALKKSLSLTLAAGICFGTSRGCRQIRRSIDGMLVDTTQMRQTLQATRKTLNPEGK